MPPDQVKDDPDHDLLGSDGTIIDRATTVVGSRLPSLADAEEAWRVHPRGNERAPSERSSYALPRDCSLLEAAPFDGEASHRGVDPAG